LLGLGLALLVALCFAPAVRGAFVYDDRLLVQRNPVITSFANLPQAFSAAYWDFLEAEAASRIGYWRPLTAIVMMGAHALGGGEPWAFHVVQIALHVAAALAAALLLRNITRDPWIGWLAAALWAVHPLHVESVAWISAVNDPLFGAFVLLGLYRHRVWVDRGASGLPLSAALCLAFGLLSKEQGSALVPCALALDLANGSAGGLRARLAHWKRAWIPYLAVAVLYWLARVAVFDSWAGGLDRSTTEFEYPPLRMAWLRVELFGGALGLMVWPLRSALFRMNPPGIDWSAASTWIALSATCIWIFGTWRALRARAWSALAWLLFLAVSLGPILLRVELLGQFLLSDRFLYLPVLGLVGLLSWSATRWRRPTLVLLCLLVIGSIAQSWRRIPVWSSELALFEQATIETPASPYPWWSLGRVQLEEYRRTKDTVWLKRALDSFERAQTQCELAQQSHPSVFATRADVLQSNLGVGYCLLHEAEIDDFHDWETPKRLFENIAKMRPDSELPLIGLALVETQRGELAEAERLLSQALGLNPRSAEAQRNLGVISMSRSNWDAARRAFEASLALRPGNLEDRVWIARALFQADWTERAEQVAESARADYPTAAAPLVVLAALARARDDGSRALGLLDEALRLEPRNAFAHHTRGQVLYESDQNVAALEAFRRACDIDTTNFDYHYNLGALLLQTGARDAALPFLKRAYEVGSGRPQLEALRELFATQLSASATDYYALARADHARGEREVARAWVERSVGLDSDYVEARYLRGLLMKLSGDPEGAVAEFQWLTERAPEAFDFWIELAGLLLGLRRGKQAVPAYEKALELVPLQTNLAPQQRDMLRERLTAELASARSM
jgi:tetratricopeptide (TPR) repeat protein